MRDTRVPLVRAITYGQARGKLGRNVASLVAAPAGGLAGRPCGLAGHRGARHAEMPANDSDRAGPGYLPHGEREQTKRELAAREASWQSNWCRYVRSEPS